MKSEELWGIEREALRITSDGSLAQSAHPFSPHNKQITVDFAEAQVELITNPHQSLDAAYYELADLQTELMQALPPDELLWPLSLALPKHQKEAKVARFNNDPQFENERKYREKLSEQYGIKTQLISGIHINYSNAKFTQKDDYMALARKILRLKPLISWYLGMSPPTFDADALAHTKFSACTPYASSLRQSRYGYSLSSKHNEGLGAAFNSFDNYQKFLNKLISTQTIEQEREFYFPVRIRENASRIEFRFFDLNPLDPLGISLDHLQFLARLIEALEPLESPHFLDGELEQILTQDNEVNLCSRGSKRPPNAPKDHTQIFESLRGSQDRPLDAFLNSIKDGDPLRIILDHAKAFRSWSRLELSTQILGREALKKGLKLNLLDESENVLKLVSKTKTEYVKQATRTSLDSYIFPLLSDNKMVVKNILSEEGIPVPEGRDYQNLQLAISDFKLFKDQAIVVKPNDTNFGTGVTIFEMLQSEQEYAHAVELAFQNANRILVEKYAQGIEFRFLVIEGNVEAVLSRVPANVVGDGNSTIRELVETKNTHPYRGSGYRRPLEKIMLGEIEAAHLKTMGYTFDSIPQRDQEVRLRLNSNISTGGDSVDHTDDMHETYKTLAVKAAKSLNMKVCGVDMIINSWEPNSSKGSATILELNYNPALHIHTFPAVGRGRPVAKALLNALFP